MTTNGRSKSGLPRHLSGDPGNRAGSILAHDAAPQLRLGLVLGMAALCLLVLSPALAFATAVPTSLTIQTSRLVAGTGAANAAILSGLVTPSPDMVGTIVHVNVLKPGRATWTYSSNRVVYLNPQGLAQWWYRYTFLPGMTSGTYSFRVFWDGNSSFAASSSGIVNVGLGVTPDPVSDITAPTTTSDATAHYVATAAIHLTAADNAGGSGVAHTYYTLDGASQVEGLVVNNSTVGDHVLEFWSVDNAGNVEAHHTANFTVAASPPPPPAADNTPPTTVSDAHNRYDGYEYSAPAVVSLTASDNVAAGIHTFCSIDHLAVMEGTTVNVFQIGNHTLEFWSVDAAGNQELPHHTVEIAVKAFDPLAPITTSNALPFYVSGGGTIFLTGFDPLDATVATLYRLDGGPVQTGTVVTVPAALGAHTLEFWSIDESGNAESPHKTANFNVILPDHTAPVTTSNASTATPYAWHADVPLTGTDEVGGSGVAHTYYTVDGGAAREGTAAIVAGVGAHTITFWSVDGAGNIESPAKTASLSIVNSPADSAAPETEHPDLLNTNQVPRLHPITAHLVATDAISGIAHTYYILDSGPTVEANSIVFRIGDVGNHTLQYWSVDYAGNVEAHHSFSFMITPEE